MKAEEIYVLKKSIKWTTTSLLIVSIFWFFFSLQAAYSYSPDGSSADLKSGSRINAGAGSSSLFLQPGTGTSGGSDTARFRIIYGTQSTTGSGFTGFIFPGTTTGLPFIDYLFSNGSSTFNFRGFGIVAIDGNSVGTSGSFIAVNNGVGTNTTLNNPTLAGVGTITASFGANGLVITATEYASVNNATGELQSQIDGKQASLVNNSPGTITNVLGYTPPANTLGSLTVALGYTPPANTIGSITTALGYTPPANTQGSITTALGYTPTNLGNTIELGTETTGNTDNVSEGSTNKYYTDARVNTTIGSSSITSPQVSPKITFTSPANGQFLKIVDGAGNVENGTSSASVDFSAVTGSASANTANFQSGIATDGKVLIGLSDVIKLPATTTAQAVQSYGQLYVYQDSYNIGGNDSYTELLLHMNNPGTNTTTDSSSNAYAVTANGSVIGTSTPPVFGSGRGYFNGTNAYYSLADSTDWTYGSGSFCLEAKIQPTSVGGTAPVIYQKIAGAGSVEFGLGGPAPGDYVTATFSNTSNTVVGNYRSTAHVGTETSTHIAFARNGTSNKIYVNGVSGTTVLTEMGATTLENLATNLMIGFSNTSSYFPGYIEEVRISKGVPRFASDSVPPGVAYEDTTTRYNTELMTPQNGNTLIRVQTGTASVTPTIYFNATHTIIGSLTSAYTSDKGTVTYALLVDSGKSISQDWVLTPSSSLVKTDLPGTPTTEVLSIIRNSDGHKFFYKNNTIADTIVSIKALNDYVAEDEEIEFELFREVHQNEYVEGEVGSRSVNIKKMKDDFKSIHINNKTVEWTDPKIVTNKTDRLKLTKAYLEMDTTDTRNNTVNYGIEIDRNCPAEILDTNGLPSMAKWQGFNFVAIKGLLGLIDEMKLELGSATAEIKKLKAIINP